MAWYSDEEYELRQECREKKSIAASAFKQRTHCGKGGRVKFPSDYLSRKELKAMNGEVKEYNLGKPMSWEEFKALPDEHKVSYIKTIRDRFGAPDVAIAEMMGINRKTLGLYLADLKIGRDQGYNPDNWDEDAFRKWVSPDHTAEEFVEGTSTENIPLKPMSWTNFKLLSDEDKIAYINDIRNYFACPNTAIAEMMGVTTTPLSLLLKPLGLSLGKNSPLGGKHKWDKDRFYRWAFPTQYLKTTEEAVSAETVHELMDEIMTNAPICEALEASESGECENVEVTIEEKENSATAPSDRPVLPIPKRGSMTFECSACDALDAMRSLLNNTNVRIQIEWEVMR